MQIRLAQLAFYGLLWGGGAASWCSVFGFGAAIGWIIGGVIALAFTAQETIRAAAIAGDVELGWMAPSTFGGVLTTLLVLGMIVRGVTALWALF